jgi:hypothetical protein
MMSLTPLQPLVWKLFLLSSSFVFGMLNGSIALAVAAVMCVETSFCGNLPFKGVCVLVNCIGMVLHWAIGSTTWFILIPYSFICIYNSITIASNPRLSDTQIQMNEHNTMNIEPPLITHTVDSDVESNGYL